jgi:hemerythrin-like domain-containing protein
LKRKPLKRHEGLQNLSREHHQGLMLAWNIQKGIAKEVRFDRIANYIHFQFEELLLPHFEFEELEVFCLLPEDNALRQQAEKDHKALVIIVKNLNTMEDCAKFAELLRKHIRFEERVLFELIQQEVGDEQLGALEGKWAENLTCLNWKDPFWN